jgi:hypothetical protein
MAKRKKASGSSSIFYKFMAGWVVVVVALLGATIFFKNQEAPCANSESCIQDLSGEFDLGETEGIFMGRAVQAPAFLAETPTNQFVLGETTNKRIEVDLTNQRLYTYEGDKLIHNFLVSTGKWGRTPTGTFSIWIKLRSTKMSGGSKALGTYYYLPNVPYTMYFYNAEVPKSRGYGIHGAYWHNNFGHPMSHGCINMKEEEVAQVYAWADPHSDKNTTYASDENPGTPVVIYGTAPNE